MNEKLDEVMTESPAWSLILIQGLLTLLMGWFLVFRPVSSVLVLVQILGLYWVVSGIISIARAFMSGDKKSGWGWTVMSGVIGVIAGMIVLNNQLFAAILTPTVLLYLIALSFFFDGVIKMIWGKLSIDQTGYERSWGSFVAGLFYALLGLALISMPLLAGLKILILTVGWLTLFTGTFLVVASFQVRQLQGERKAN